MLGKSGGNFAAVPLGGVAPCHGRIRVPHLSLDFGLGHTLFCGPLGAAVAGLFLLNDVGDMVGDVENFSKSAIKDVLDYRDANGHGWWIFSDYRARMQMFGGY